MMQLPSPDFAASLHRILVVERVRSVADVAKATGLTYPALYARLAGRVPLSLDEARRLLCEVPDIRLVDALLAGTRFSAFSRAPLTGGASGRGAVAIAMSAMRQVAEIASELAAQGESGAPDPDAPDRLSDMLRDAERSLALLRHALPQACRRAASALPAELAPSLDAEPVSAAAAPAASMD